MQAAQTLTIDQIKAANLHVTADKPGVTCFIDNAEVHNVAHYIENNLNGWSVKDYCDVYGQTKESLYSETYLGVRAKRTENIRLEMLAAVVPLRAGNTGEGASKKESLAKVFKLSPGKESRAKGGKLIQTTVLTQVGANVSAYVPEVDEDYVFDAVSVRQLNLAFELRKNVLCFGLHGTGKTSILEQFCADRKSVV